MNRGLNKVMLIGTLGKDPETRTLESGTVVTTFPLATNNSYKDKNGDEQKDTQWHNIEAWGKTAEILDKFLKSGNNVYIEGSLKTQSYTKDGETNARYTTKVVVREFNFLPGGTKNNNTQAQAQPQAAQPQAPQAQPQAQPQATQPQAPQAQPQAAQPVAEAEQQTQSYMSGEQFTEQTQGGDDLPF